MAKQNAGIDEEEGETGLSYKQIRIRHTMGWMFLACYLFITAYYVCLFGINYGAEYTNKWLQSFAIALSQELAFYIPLRVLILFCVLPSVTSPKIHVRRFDELQPQCASWQVAHSCPELAAAQLIVSGRLHPGAGTSGHLKTMFGERLTNHCLVGRDQERLVWWTKCRSLVMAAACWPLLYAPAALAEFFLDFCIAAAANYIFLYVFLVYLMSGTDKFTFGCCFAITFLLLMLLIFFATQPRHRKALLRRFKQMRSSFCQCWIAPSR